MVREEIAYETLSRRGLESGAPSRAGRAGVDQVSVASGAGDVIRHQDEEAGSWGRVGPGAPASETRLLLYSHDSWGLGHLRRNLTLAYGLRRQIPNASILLVTGSPCATFFELPPGVEILKLPSVSKSEDGRYVSRHLPGSVSTTLMLRRRLLFEAFTTYEPHLLLVDHRVLGVHGEVLDVLRAAKETGTRTLLGLRDIVDAPEKLKEEWSGEEICWALKEGYDRICVYGTPSVFDPRLEYRLPPEIAARLEFQGYVVRARNDAVSRPRAPETPRVLVTVGGGEDGEARIRAYLDALALGPIQWASVIVPGPLMPSQSARRLKREVEGRRDVRIHRSHSDLPRLLDRATIAVGMAGYNSCAEFAHAGVLAVYLPRRAPRREQLIRAERLEGLGFGRCVHPADPAELRSAIEEALVARAPRAALPFDGCRNTCLVVAELLGIHPPAPFPAPVRANACPGS